MFILFVMIVYWIAKKTFPLNWPFDCNLSQKLDDQKKIGKYLLNDSLTVPFEITFCFFLSNYGRYFSKQMALFHANKKKKGCFKTKIKNQKQFRKSLFQ